MVYVNEKTGTLSLNYLGFIAPLTRAVQALIDLFANVDKKQALMQTLLQEQNAKIEAQNKVITEQNEKILKLQNDVAWLLREKSKLNN